MWSRAGRIGVPLGIHCHDDCGLAAANTLAAVDAGAIHVQGTLLGFGERCGNACLATVIPDLQLKAGYACIPQGAMKSLKDVCYRVAELTNISIPKSQPYIGRAAFAHKAGMHVDGMRKAPGSFEHVPPEAVGNERRLLLSEMSGRSALLRKSSGLRRRSTGIRRSLRGYSKGSRSWSSQDINSRPQRPASSWPCARSWGCTSRPSS